MTKKDFELIAKVISDLVQDQKERGAFANNPDLHTVAEWFADELEEINPRFDRVKFRDACGVK
jgi:hypothetical protein